LKGSSSGTLPIEEPFIQQSKINQQFLSTRYLVRARVKPGREADLLQAIEEETLGQGSVAEGEYLRNMQKPASAPTRRPAG